MRPFVQAPRSPAIDLVSAPPTRMQTRAARAVFTVISPILLGLSAASCATAPEPAPDPVNFLLVHDVNRDGVLTKLAFVDDRGRLFDRIDRNGDGYLDRKDSSKQSDLAGLGRSGRGGGGMGGAMAGMGGGGGMGAGPAGGGGMAGGAMAGAARDRVAALQSQAAAASCRARRLVAGLDADEDKRVSRREFTDGVVYVFDVVDANADDRIDPLEAQEFRAEMAAAAGEP